MLPGICVKYGLLIISLTLLLASIQCEDVTASSRPIDIDIISQDYLVPNSLNAKSPWSDYGNNGNIKNDESYLSSMPSLRYGYPASVAGFYQLPYRPAEDHYPFELLKSSHSKRSQNADGDAKGQYRLLRFGRSGIRLRYGRSDPPMLRFG